MLNLTIDTDNAAFSDGAAGFECARILRRVAGIIQDWDGYDDFDMRLLDTNGNHVGEVNATEIPPE
jgi:hypothetical protein